MIGFLGAGSPEPNARNVAAFRQGLAEAGYIDGQNVTIEFRWANYQNRLVPGLAADLIRRQPAVLVATGAISPALAAKAATSTIPIVFASGGDPVKYGLVASLNRPGGNITGVTLSEELAGKRLGLLRELVLKARAVAYLSPDSRILTFEQQRSDIVAAARALGLQIIAVEANSDRDFEPAFATFVQRGADALVVGIAPFLFGVPSNRDKILELAARHKIPAMYPNRSDAVSGGLMSYSADVQGSYRLLGVHYVGQILRGAKPADLPVQQPTKFELVINLKTAKALGLEIPPVLLVQAEEVIE
jgi:putative ABC transport system substrate-binding protein